MSEAETIDEAPASRLVVTSGAPAPLGVTPDATGVNVAVLSANAEAIDFCLFDADGEGEVARLALPERTGDVFHGHIEGVTVGARYGLRAHGPFRPQGGLRFDAGKLLLDPYALEIDRPFVLHPAMLNAPDGTDSAPVMPKAIVARPMLAEPWRDAPPWSRTSIAELHVRGFSLLHPDVPARLRGTWAALATAPALTHFAALGVTTIEVMPAAAWIDERHLPPLGLTNYWGYNPVAFMAPDPRLAPGGWREVRETVAKLNAAGLEVVLDVVFNHSGEGDELGPTLSLRGLDNATYYRLDPSDPSRYVNDAGCGNILAAERRPVVRLVLDALRAWALYGGINGFRFDLMTTLGRRPGGFDPDAPLIAAIEQDPVLGRLKLIAEPWDIGPGGYRVGAFDAHWGEWNDRFRDDVRRFWRGDGSPAAMATRLAGSSDLFWAKRRSSRSVNFVTAHDGFTLADLVSYVGKHNEANGESNRDGTDGNSSWNHGVEGPSQDVAVVDARRQDQRNLLLTLVLARGTPMFGPGAELGQTQGGNNNAYSQDNATSWIDWSKPSEALTGFIKSLLDFRSAHPAIGEDRFLTGLPREGNPYPDVAWRLPDGRELAGSAWDHLSTPTLIGVFSSPRGPEPADRVAVVLHAGSESLEVALPELRPGATWQLAIDTASSDKAAAVSGTTLTVPPRSAAVLAEVLS